MGGGGCGRGAIASQLSGCWHAGCQSLIFKLQMLTKLFWFLNEIDRRFGMKMHVSVNIQVTVCIYVCVYIPTHMYICIYRKIL